MLILPIKKKWYNMIVSGEKKEEYRSLTRYYYSRFKKYEIGSNKPFEILLRNGYSSTSPTVKCVVTVRTGVGKEKWGAVPNEAYFVLEIKEVKKYEVCKESR